MTRPVLLYDGDCGFCTRSAELIARHVPTRADLIPYQTVDVGLFGTTTDRASQEVVWVGAEGHVNGGAQAVALLLMDAGRLWAPLGRLMRLPLVRDAAAYVYKLVSVNRHRLPGTTPACARPPEQRPQRRRP